MFLKLLKYKFNAHRNLFIILSAVVLSLSAVCAAALWFLQQYHFFSNIDPDLYSVLVVLGNLFLTYTVYYGMLAYTIATAIILFVQFYKNHFSDEGYLTFTLPATTHQHLLSSFLNILIWLATTMLVLIICIVILIGPAYFLSEFINGIRDSMMNIGIEQPVVGTTLLGISSLLTGCLIAMLSISIGCVAVQRKKLLAAFGIGYGIISTFTVLTYILVFLSIVGDIYIMHEILNNDKFYFILTMLVPLTMHAGVCVGGYFLMHRLVDRKLNLP